MPMLDDLLRCALRRVPSRHEARVFVVGSRGAPMESPRARAPWLVAPSLAAGRSRAAVSLGTSTTMSGVMPLPWIDRPFGV